VLEVSVIGVPSEKWGETPKAIVALREGANASGEELIDFCRQALAHYKCPTSVDFVERLPRNPSGKVLKGVLREPYWAGRSRRVS
jgi:acyl-CoA synthetase (AMP-forming)/AMP-acid ligase II